MRFFVLCDICGKYFKTEGMSLPKKIMLVDGMDLCDGCRMEYNKRRIKMIKEMIKSVDSVKEVSK